jgi:hypothetical protein
MGNGGKVVEQQRARELRADSWTLADIAAELGVAKSSVSLWVRDVDFTPNPRRTARNRPPNKLQRQKAAEIERFTREGRQRFVALSQSEFFTAGLGLYAGDGAKRGTTVQFSNSNPALVGFFCAWLRTFFDIEEARLRVQLYLHTGLDLDSADDHWSNVTGIGTGQFQKAYRALADPTRRHNKHIHGCCHVKYASTSMLRQILGLMDGLFLISSPSILPG